MRRIKQPIGGVWKWFWAAIGIVALISVYSYESHAQHMRNSNDTTIPNLWQLIQGFWDITTPRTSALGDLFGTQEKLTFWGGVQKTWLYQDATATYWRLFKGLALGSVISIVLGVLMGCYEWIEAMFAPVISFLAKVPATAMLAVFFVMVGTGESLFVVLVAFGVAPILTQSIYLSAKHDVHEEQVNKAYTLGASNFEAVWNVVVRIILPRLIESVRLQIGPAMVFLIAAEYMVAQVGMGYQIRMQQRLLNMAVVYDYILILGLTGLLLDKLFTVVRRKACPWFEKGT